MPANILNTPRSQADQLGLPIPDDAHAVSVCLPTWDDIVGYEEKDDRVISRLLAAYPRFGFHPLIKKLCHERIDRDGWQGLPFASAAAAERAVRFCKTRAGVDARTMALPGCSSNITAVSVADQDFPTLKEYWQHAGENLSSRAIEAMLSGREVTFQETNSRRAVRSSVAEIQQTEHHNVFLYPSGMASIAAAYRTTQSVKPGPTCQFGFPYVDTLKVQQKFSTAGCVFLPLGDQAALKELEQQSREGQVSVVFCELPTNPLLATPDLKRLWALANECNFLLVVDDTLTACGNVHTLPYSDITVTSLTKYFSGIGNVLAGSLTVNPAGRFAESLKQHLVANFKETLCDDDVRVLEANSRDLADRMRATNESAFQLAEFLKQHDHVQHVYYPNSDDPNYEGLKSAAGGYGGLMSIVLQNASATTPAFYDRLNVNKGPNLGTKFTLCCPFTMLAHYNELDFAESCGVSRWLLRISIGLEGSDELIRRFSDAFPRE